MNNSIYNTLKPAQTNSQTNILNAFNQFRRTFTGDPKQTVMNMLQSGQMTQQQFEQLKGMANSFQAMMR